MNNYLVQSTQCDAEVRTLESLYAEGHGDGVVLRTLHAEPPERRGRLDAWDAVKAYVFAGCAVFTLRSLKTGMRYTYKVRVKKEDVVQAEEYARLGDPDASARMLQDAPYFVNLLRGPDNTADFAYMGVLRRTWAFSLTSASRMGREAPAVKALVWFLERARLERTGLLGVTLEFWHDGRCGRCGRKLTVPESVASGLGPECAGRLV
jgi:hypothetical protein